MKIHLLTTIISTFLLLLLKNASGVSTCPHECDCFSDNELAVCSNKNLESLPSGHWPLILHLVIDNNNIEKLTEDMLKAFPNLETLIMNDNIVNELRLEAFTVVKNLSHFTCLNCDIKTIVPLPADKQLPSLNYLTLRNTSITSVSENVLIGVGSEYLSLDLGDNELVVPGDRPFLRSSSLARLTLSLTDCSTISAETFSALENLKFLDLRDTEIIAISYQFSSLKNLEVLILEDNPFTKISGPLPSELTALRLAESALEEIDINDLEKMTKLKYIDITNTPMACNCTFEPHYQWAKSRDIGFDALCEDGSPCPFYTQHSDSEGLKFTSSSNN